MSDWTPSMVAMLKVLWAEGLSAREIADRISRQFGVEIGRNSVIGKSHRIGVKSRPSPIASERSKPSQPRKTRAKPRFRFVSNEIAAVLKNEIIVAVDLNHLPHVKRTRREEAPMIESKRVTLAQAQDNRACRWPDNVMNLHQRAETYCGHPQAEGSSYCQHHDAQMRSKATGSLRAAERIPERVR